MSLATSQRIIGMLWVLAAGVWLGGCGPGERAYMFDPVTGHDRTTITRLGIKLYDRTEQTPLSRWAEANGLPDLKAGDGEWITSARDLYGWIGIRGFSCGMGPNTMHAMMDGPETVNGRSRSERLRTYQRAVLTTKDQPELRRHLIYHGREDAVRAVVDGP